MKIKAISLWEPWASLIRTGAKTFETRSWPTLYRGPLLICAAKGGLPKSELIYLLSRWDMQGGLAPLIGRPLDLTSQTWAGIKPEHLNFGKAVAIVDLIDCRRTEDMNLGEIQAEQFFGDFSPGRYAWKLILKESIEPFSVRGKQGFFDVEI